MVKKVYPARLSPPLKCGDYIDIVCNVEPIRGKSFTCKVYPRDSKKLCAGAIINIMNGTIRFYGE